MSKWVGKAPTRCDLCRDRITKVFYDARLPKRRGVWGSICDLCFIDEDCSLGTGSGQRYERSGTEWLCTGGGKDDGQAKEENPKGSGDIHT